MDNEMEPNTIPTRPVRPGKAQRSRPLIRLSGPARVRALFRASCRRRIDGRTLEFIKDQYRHFKTILALGAGAQLLSACGISATLPDGQPDPGLIIASAKTDDFIVAIARHRHFARETDPPRV